MNTTPPTPNQPPVLEMENVTVTSVVDPETPEVENIDWQLRRGEFWVVNGQHGSGKSHLLATVAGLQRPLRGKVRWFGRDIDELSETELVEERLKIGLVFQNGGRMFRNLSVLENVALPLRYHRNLSNTDSAEELREILDLTDLASHADKMAGTLTPSWQQRVGLARALVSRPEVLLLDKPTIGLGHLRWWLEFLGRLLEGAPFTKGKPVTLVVATDDIRPWQEHGKQFVALKGKRWHWLGERADLAGKETTLRELWAEETM